MFNISHVPVHFFFFFGTSSSKPYIPCNHQANTQSPGPRLVVPPTVTASPCDNNTGEFYAPFLFFWFCHCWVFWHRAPFFLRHFNGVFSSRVHASYGGPADSICTMHICARAPKKRKKKIILKKLMTLAGVYTLLRSNKGVMNHMPNEFIV